LLDVLVHADATLLAQAWEVYYAARQSLESGLTHDG
jgi:hypothetical protein